MKYGRYGPQLEATSATRFLEQQRASRHADAFVTMGYTMSDITDSSKGYNFLFGRANFSAGCGIFSFARYRSDDPSPNQFLRRCCMVLCHEIGHLFGIAHCIYCCCLMSGSNHLDEAVSRPFALCPADTIKLQVHTQSRASKTQHAPSSLACRFCNFLLLRCKHEADKHHKMYAKELSSRLTPLQASMGAVGGIDLVARQRRLLTFFSDNDLAQDAGCCCRRCS